MKLQTAHRPSQSEPWRYPSLAHEHLLIYYRAKVLTVQCCSHADVSLETHCNKMNCHCFLAELYKLPHQSHNMGPPPLTINQWERHRRHKMPLHFPEAEKSIRLTSVGISMFYSGRQENEDRVVLSRPDVLKPRHRNWLTRLPTMFYSNDMDLVSGWEWQQVMLCQW